EMSKQGFGIWGAMLQTFSGMLTKLNQDLNGLTKSIGEAFAPTLRPVLEGIIGSVRGLTQGLTSLAKEYGPVVRSGLEFAAGVGGSILLVSNLGTIAKVAGSILLGPLVS